MQRHHTHVWSGLLATALLLVFSCQKTVTSSSSTTTSPVFSASFAGVNWKADTVWALLLDDSFRLQKTMTISGYGAKKLVTIVMTDSSRSGTDSSLGILSYASTSDWLNTAIFTYAAASGSDTVWSAYGVGYAGQATVTADNSSSKTVSGSFQFSATVLTTDSMGITIDTVKVTDGVFNQIPYGFRYLR